MCVRGNSPWIVHMLLAKVKMQIQGRNLFFLEGLDYGLCSESAL